MKKIIITFLATLFITGCTTPLFSYQNESDISNDSLSLLFVASDEEKITVSINLPKAKNYGSLVADYETKHVYRFFDGSPCGCLLSSCNGCERVTIQEPINPVCFSEISEENGFDNKERSFYTRHYFKASSDKYFNYYCVNNNSNIVDESFFAIFEKKKEGKILSYSIKPTKRIVTSEWKVRYLPFMKPDLTLPTNDQELAMQNQSMDYPLKHPVELDDLLKESVSVIYDPKIEEFTVKYDPVSTINKLKSRAKGKYIVGVSDERHDCHYLSINKNNTNYTFEIPLKLCRINNTNSEVTLGNATIEITKLPVVDLTTFSKEINQIIGYLK